MSIPITDPYGGWGETYHFANEVTEKERQTHSRLLGPDGKPLSYEPKQPLGFDLTPKHRRSEI